MVDRAGIERPVEIARAVVGHRAKHGAGGIGAVAGDGQVRLDQPLRHRMHGNEPDLAALAPDPEMHHALTALHVLDPQAAQLLAAHAVIEQGGQDGAIARALERVRRRRLQELALLGVAQRQRAAFIAVGHPPLHAVDGIAGHGVALAEIIEQ
jgi:hypothetical protein